MVGLNKGEIKMCEGTTETMKLEASFSTIEFQSLPMAAVQLCIYDKRKMSQNHADFELMQLVDKSRAYLNLLFDKATANLNTEEISNGNEKKKR